MKESLQKTKIKKLQIDPYGYCNAKCWFCPVRYIPQPERGASNMPVELIDKIFSNMVEERGRLVDSSFDTFVTAHYNEILLYKDYDKMLELARKYKLKTFVLSNGISINKRNIELIKEYRDVVIHVGFNIPAFKKELWANRSGFKEDQFERMIDNIKLVEHELSYLGKELQLHVNGIGYSEFSTFAEKGPDFDKLGIELNPFYSEHDAQFELAKKLFPKININKGALIDRAGTIRNVISNEKWLNERGANKKVVGCNNWGDRITEWISINSAGDVFLCCNDYNFDYVFGNIKDKTLNQIWNSDQHLQTLDRALNEICRKCTAAVFR